MECSRNGGAARRYLPVEKEKENSFFFVPPLEVWTFDVLRGLRTCKLMDPFPPPFFFIPGCKCIM